MEHPRKHFKKRDAILACLCQTTTHPSAEWIYNRLKPEYSDISLGTVYRNLALFKKQGLIASVGTVGGVERFDGNPAPHVHFICESCGKVTDLYGIQAPAHLCSAAAQCTGGRVDLCRLTFQGVCGACMAKVKNG